MRTAILKSPASRPLCRYSQTPDPAWNLHEPASWIPLFCSSLTCSRRGNLLLDRTVEEAAAGARPARNFEDVNLVVGQFQEGFKRSPALFVELRVAGRG